MKLFSACIGVYRNRLIKAADRKELKKRIEKWHRLTDTTLCQTLGAARSSGGCHGFACSRKKSKSSIQAEFVNVVYRHDGGIYRGTDLHILCAIASIAIVNPLAG
jgi:hypothetical protein